MRTFFLVCVGGGERCWLCVCVFFRHEHLIGQEGTYAQMWRQQLESKNSSSVESSLDHSTEVRRD